MVGADAAGQLVLVLRVAGKGPEPVLACLDALAFLRRSAAVLVRDLDDSRLRPELPPRVILVARRFGKRLLRRLEPLLPDPVELYEERRLRSAGGSRVYLAPAGDRSETLEADARGAEEALQALAAGLPESGRVLIGALVDRLSRIDDELERRAVRGGITWVFRGEPLARAEVRAGELEVSSPPGRRRRALYAEGDLDVFLEEVMGLFSQRLDVAPSRRGAESGLARMEEGDILTREEHEALEA